MENEKPLIYEYTDYRSFLKALYDHLKESTTYFSFRYFSKKAGFSSPNYLKLVIQGERNISEDSIDRFAVALKLNRQESLFFKLLVQFNQSANSAERTENALKLFQSKIYQKLNPLKEEQLNYYKRWYQVAVRELALCKEFKNDPAWIAHHFVYELKAKEVKEAIDSLIKLGMLQEDKNGVLRPVDKNVTTLDEVTSSFVSLYHKEMMERAKESIDVTPALDREVSSICVPVSEKTFNDIKARIQDFKKELITIANSDVDPNRVYQLNIQLFPLTKKV